MRDKKPYPAICRSGFTLIEILVVLVIIGITLGFAILSFGDFGQSRRIITAAEQTLGALQSIRHQAMLQSKAYGLSINSQGYTVVEYTQARHWEPAQSTFLGKPTPFPKQGVVAFQPLNPHQKPGIIFYSTGEITPFRLVFGTPKQPSIIQIIGKENGELSLKREYHE